MKRRSFLGLLGGAVAAPAVKVNAETKRQTVNRIPFAQFEPDKSPYNSDMVRFSVLDENGKRGYIRQGPTA